jgi:DNA-binding transcriptional LysR family regulator
MSSSRKNSSTRKTQWGGGDPPTVPDWEAAHSFLEVARCGSFRAAAQKLKQSINVLRRRLDGFEQELGFPLLIRHINGVQLTAEGETIYAAALQMESASFGLLQARQLSSDRIEGEVTIATTDGLGGGWLMPQLVAFQHANPNLTVNLRCAQNPPDLLRLEADLSVQVDRPTERDLKVVRLGRLHVMLFATKGYLDAHGVPGSVADLANHRLVVMADREGRWEQHYERLFPDFSPASLIRMRNNLGSTHFAAVLAGAGIGAIPSYASIWSNTLVPLHLNINSHLDIWLVYRADAKRIERIRRTIDWIAQVYDPRRFPWFRDEFIHPERFGEIYKGPELKNAFVHAMPRD